MAIYHCSMKMISRSAGKSIVASAAYRHACKLEDARTGEVYDFTRKRGVVFSEIYCPCDVTAAWVKDREQLWNRAEAAEKRKDSRLGRELVLALPSELTSEQRRELIGKMADFLVKRYGVVVDAAIHAPGRQGDERNIHAHMLLSSRRIGQEGFGEKTHELDKQSGPAEVSLIRSEWARFANLALERAGQSVRIDHRTLEAQGIEREPTIHLGVSASAMERRGIQTERGSINRRIRERQADLEELAKLERQQQESQKRELETAERLRPELERWAVVAHGLFSGEAGAMFDQTRYPKPQCRGMLDFMRCLNLVDESGKVQQKTIAGVLQSGKFWVEQAKIFCLMKKEQGQRSVSFAEIADMGRCISSFETKYREEQAREKRIREQREAIEQERQDKQRIQAWQQLGSPQYTEDEKRCIACYDRLGHYERQDIAQTLARETENLSRRTEERGKAERLVQQCERTVSGIQEKLAHLGVLGSLFQRSGLEKKLAEAESQRLRAVKIFEEKDNDVKLLTEKVRFYIDAQKGPDAIKRRTAEGQERQTRAMTPEIKAALARQGQRDELEKAREEQEREKARKLKRQQERERGGWER